MNILGLKILNGCFLQIGSNSLLILTVSILISCAKNDQERSIEGINWERINDIDRKGIGRREELWRDSILSAYFIHYYYGKKGFYSGSKNEYIFISSSKKKYLLRTELNLSVIGDKVFFYTKPFDAFSQRGNQWYKIQGNSYVLINPPVNPEKIKLMDSVYEYKRDKFYAKYHLKELKNIFEIKNDGIYYIPPMGFGSIHSESLVELNNKLK